MAGLPDPASPIPTSPQAASEESVRFLDHLIETFPANPDALELKARHLEWFGKSKQALECWEKCLKLNPNYAYAYVGIASLAASQEDHRKAADLLRKATSLDPENFQARIALAEALIASNQPKEAIAVLEVHLKRDPRSQGFFLLGQAYLQLEQYEKARDNLEAAVQKYPRYGDAYYRLANVYTSLGQQDKAKQCIQKSRELKAEQRRDERAQKKQYDDLDAVRGHIAEIYARAAGIYFVNHRHPEAERLWRRAAALSPTNIECRQGLAWLCRQQVRIPEAIEFLKQLAAIQPKNAEIWFEMGQMYADLTDFSEAESAVAHAAQLTPASQRYRDAHQAIQKAKAEKEQVKRHAKN